MASIDKREDGAYRARWREYPGGPQKTRQFARKGDAQTFLDGARGDLAQGVYIDPAGARVLLRDYAESWRAAQVHRRSNRHASRDLPPSPRLPHARPPAHRRHPAERDPGVGEVPERALAPGSVEVIYR